MSTTRPIKADYFLVREWPGTRNRRYWATIRWGVPPENSESTVNACIADSYGFWLECKPAHTRAQAERIARDYAKRLGLRLPRPRYT
jgi:hypothetical protein